MRLAETVAAEMVVVWLSCPGLAQDMTVRPTVDAWSVTVDPALGHGRDHEKCTSAAVSVRARKTGTASPIRQDPCPISVHEP